MKMKANLKVKSLISLLLIAIVLVSSMFATNITAEDTSNGYVYFTVEKTWQNDIAEERPSSIEIHVVGSDGSDNPGTLTAADGWKKAFKLPAKSGESDITYQVYETVPDKYQSIATAENPLEIKNYVMANDVKHSGETFKVVKDNIDNVPEGNIVILEDLMLSEAYIEYPNQNEFTLGDYDVYNNKGGKSDVCPRVVYTGNLVAGPNRLGNIRMTWNDKAVDVVSGERYNVQINVDDIVVYSLAAIDNSAELTRYVVLLANQDGKLHLQAYSGGLFDKDDLRKSIVGVEADVAVRVLNKDGSPVKGYAKMSMMDLDIADYASAVDHGDVTYSDATGREKYYGLDYANPIVYEGEEYRFVESVKLTKGVASDIHLDKNSVLAFRADETGALFAPTKRPAESTSAVKSLKYLADVSDYEFTWRGSNCGTIIIADGAEPSVPASNNVITNVSSLYKVQFFYQEFGEEGAYYTKEPNGGETAVTMVAPGTFVEATDAQKTPAEDKKDDYVLGEAMKESWSGTTTAVEEENPLILKVYFKKQLRVIYHDNVEDKVFDQQKNAPLEYMTNTPDFDTDTETEGIQAGDPTRTGYDFLGWSEESDSEVIEVPTLVTKNADYWAHWVPGDNKYKVEYYYEVNGKYPTNPDYTSDDRAAKTEDEVSIIEADKVPVKANYYLNKKMTADWTGIVSANGGLVLKVYFKQKTKPVTPSYIPPVTGVE